MGRKARSKRERPGRHELEAAVVEAVAQATVAQMSPLEIGLTVYPTAKPLALHSVPQAVVDDHLQRYSQEELERGQFFEVLAGRYVFFMDHEAKRLRDRSRDSNR